MASEADSLERWFTIADTNRDGRIEGSEAITFFQRSNLPRETLKEVWNRTAGRTPYMTKQQFYGAIRLVSLAQLTGGSFTAQQATQLLTGISPPAPLPLMVGLTPGVWTPESAAATSPTYTQGIAQPQMQYTGGHTMPSSPPTIQATGQTPSQQYTGGQPSTHNIAATFPPLPMEEYSRYGQFFQSLDTDHDGLVHGGQCIELFSSRGVDRIGLKQIWEVVAGSAGQINGDQFIKCLYLIELCRRGIPIPTVLPAGQFPPIAQSVTGYTSSGGYGPRDTGGIPSLPAKVSFEHQDPSAYSEWRGPTPNESMLAALDPMQRERLINDRIEAQRKDEELYRLDQEAEFARHRKDTYERALQELTIFKSRMDVATMEAQEKVKRETDAADEMESRYQQVRNGAEAAAHESGSYIQSLNEAQNRKLEVQTKLQEMQAELSAMEAHHPEAIQTIELEIQGLHEAVVSTENRRNSIMAELESFKHQQELLKRRQGDLQMVCAAAEAEVHSASGDIDKLLSAVESTKDTKDVEQIQKLLREAARVYSNLYSHACKAGVEIPVEARISLYGNDFAWNDDLISAGIDSSDWHEDGFVLVDVFPDIKEDLDAEFENAIAAAIQETEQNRTIGDTSFPKNDGFETAFPSTAQISDTTGFANFDAFAEPVKQITGQSTEVPKGSGFAVTFDEPGAFSTSQDKKTEGTGFEAVFVQQSTNTSVNNAPVQGTPLSGFGFEDSTPPMFEAAFPTVETAPEPQPEQKQQQQQQQQTNVDETNDPFGGSAFT